MNEYLTVLAEEAGDNKPFLLQHLQELMEDAEIYSWRAVRDYHVAWLLNIEQGRASWKDTDKKNKLRRTLVWNRSVPSPISPSNSPVLAHHTTQASAGRGKDGYFSLSSKAADKVCQIQVLAHRILQ